MNLLDESGRSLCNGPTYWATKVNQVCTLVAELRVDTDFRSEEFKWKCVIGQPKGWNLHLLPNWLAKLLKRWILNRFQHYRRDQTLFKNFHLCEGSEEGHLVLSRQTCSGTLFKASSKRYNIVVNSLRMPSEKVMEKFYLSNGYDHPGTLGLDCRE
ncbi:uncharacterized protein LOC128983679 [Macrosteles quadrilineatus]|uniref:uncharacterized protein LOC128983679 n=1 Tax=Macrosteles quadrilineatus TaxID=74068 RepID=UPI0023E31FF0|nr:uncharacterized protein LOC128983679 [Macrosteles quadrilineatus]